MRVVFTSIFVSICVLCLTKMYATEMPLQNIPINDGETHLYKVFDCLGKAYVIAQSIENEEDRIAISNTIQLYIKRLEIVYKDKKYEKFKETAIYFQENLGEILADSCSDLHVREQLFLCINEMAEELD